MKKSKIQKVELPDLGIAIHCPFCGTKVTNAADTQEMWLAGTPCKHTLFVAHDEDFEYQSEYFKEHIEQVIDAIEETEEREDAENASIDELTDLAELEDAIKFAFYSGPPAIFGSYVGFKATDPE